MVWLSDEATEHIATNGDQQILITVHVLDWNGLWNFTLVFDLNYFSLDVKNFEIQSRD